MAPISTLVAAEEKPSFWDGFAFILVFSLFVCELLTFLPSLLCRRWWRCWELFITPKGCFRLSYKPLTWVNLGAGLLKAC